MHFLCNGYHCLLDQLYKDWIKMKKIQNRNGFLSIFSNQPNQRHFHLKKFQCLRKWSLKCETTFYNKRYRNFSPICKAHSEP